MPLLRGPYNARPPAGAAPPFWGPSPQAGGLRITSKKSAIFSHFRCPSFSKILSRYSELVREAQLRKVEEKLVQAVEEARKGAFPLEDLHEMLDVLYRGEYL